MNINDAIERLRRQLPLSSRQRTLSAELRSLHQALLHSFIQQGKPLGNHQIAAQWPGLSPQEAVRNLAEKDLVVLDKTQTQVVGSYPMTMEETPHRIRIEKHHFYAMCALDALSIGPMFHMRVAIDSCCAVTRTPLHILMRDQQLVQIKPQSTIQVGIRWQPPCGVAAHSMCREMVFLKDKEAAQKWLALSETKSSLFTLMQAVEFGSGFFSPLL